MSLDSHPDALTRYIGGEDDQLEAAIVECMPLVDGMTDSLVRQWPKYAGLTDDIRSDGYETLIITLPKLREQSVKNPRSYLSGAIYRHRQRMIDQWNGCGLSNRPREMWDRLGDQPPVEGFQEYDHGHDPFKVVELRETIHDLCRSPTEHIMVEMREQGFTVREVAEHLDMSTGAVSETLNEIHERLQAELAS